MKRILWLVFVCLMLAGLLPVQASYTHSGAATTIHRVAVRDAEPPLRTIRLCIAGIVQGDRIEEDPTGLLNDGMRYTCLDGGLRVFLTKDPAGFVDGPNLYTYVRQNPWSKFDPEGLSVMDDWNDSAASLCAKGGFCNNAAAYGICFGSTALNAFSLGSFGKNCRVQDQVESGEVSMGKGLAKMAGNSAVAGASLAVGGGAGGLVAKAGGGLVMQGAAVGFAQSTSQIAGERTVAAATGTQYDGSVGGDVAKVGYSTAGGSAFGAFVKGLNATVGAPSNSAMITRYMTQGEVDEALNTGAIPNYGPKGPAALRPTHVTTDSPLDSAAEAQKAYELDTTPTHRATVPASRVQDLGPAPDGRPQTSGGGNQNATSQPIPVNPSEIKPLNP